MTVIVIHCDDFETHEQEILGAVDCIAAAELMIEEYCVDFETVAVTNVGEFPIDWRKIYILKELCEPYKTFIMVVWLEWFELNVLS